MDEINLILSKITVKEAELDTALEGNDIAKADALTKELDTLSGQVKAHNANAAKLEEIKASKAARADYLTKPVHKYALPGGVSAGRIDAGESELDRQKSPSHFLQMIGYTGMLENHHAREVGHATLQKLYGANKLDDFDERYEKSMKSQGITKAALAESAGVTGGYTAPPEYSKTLFALAAEDAIVAGKTDEYALQGRELVLPTLDQTAPGVATGQTPFFGGVIATWAAEAATRTETEPKFRDLRLVANELAGYALASRNLIQDNVVALEQRLTKLFAGAVGWYRDYAFLQGNGVDKPQGILNSAATISVTRTTASVIKYADLTNMYGKLLPQSVKRAYWVIQQSAITSMLQMVDTAGNLIIQPYYPGSPGGPATVRPVMTMLGMPVVATEKLPALGTKGDLLLIDPMLYATATRQEIEIGASEHYKYLNNQMTYRFIFRGDGRSWLNNPITLQDGSTQVSPFVALN